MHSDTDRMDWFCNILATEDEAALDRAGAMLDAARKRGLTGRAMIDAAIDDAWSVFTERVMRALTSPETDTTDESWPADVRDMFTVAIEDLAQCHATLEALKL